MHPGDKERKRKGRERGKKGEEKAGW